MLNEFIVVNREEIIRRCRVKGAARSQPLPLMLEIEHGVPILLDQLVDALRLRQAESPAVDATAGEHGYDLRRHGFSVSAVVHGYGDVCQSITELAVETNAPISADDFRVLNGCLDGAIAHAVTEYSRDGGPTVREGRLLELQPLSGSAQELQRLIRAATVAFEVIHSGSLGAGGSTGTILLRNLKAATVLADRSVADVQVTPARSL
jgi:hypothetical protein